MNKQYEPRLIEKDIQSAWENEKKYEAKADNREKFYCLSMFPYPSGKLHMGHVRNYTIGDVISRFKRMNNFNVFQPMGWDAFGLPAENAAIANKVSPDDWTRENIEHMKVQLKSLGLSYDWSKELKTCDTSYYKWEQLIFKKFADQGLVYRKKAIVNWDPVDNTVLANEQVIDGKGWRSGAIVERKKLNQWFFNISKFSQDLLDGLDKLEQWPNKVKTMQKNWIGKSQGLQFDFKTSGAPKGFEKLVVQLGKEKKITLPTNNKLMKMFKDAGVKPLPEEVSEKVKDGKLDPLSKMGKSKLTGSEIQKYYNNEGCLQNFS